jgi:hypothetical protein
MANGRCRMHGGRNVGAPPGNSNAMTHGRTTAVALAAKREAAAKGKAVKQVVREVVDDAAIALAASKRKQRRKDGGQK